MLTTRDLSVVEFLRTYKVANTSTIQRLFYPSLSVCQRRLKAIAEDKSCRIKRIRDNVSSEYIYYGRSCHQIKHSLLVSEFYGLLKSNCEVKNFIVEPTFNNIRPDGLFGYVVNGKGYLGLLEVEISNKGFDWNKYIKFYSSGDFLNHGLKAMPVLFIISDSVKIPLVEFKVILIKTDMSDFRVL